VLATFDGTRRPQIVTSKVAILRRSASSAAAREVLRLTRRSDKIAVQVFPGQVPEDARRILDGQTAKTINRPTPHRSLGAESVHER
jgi:hypothetical protein